LAQALRVAAFFGTTAEFWLNLQSHYDLVMAKEGFDEALLSRISEEGGALTASAVG